MKRPVGRPPEFKEQLHFLAVEGTIERMRLARGDESQSDFLRRVVGNAIKSGLRKRTIVQRELARRRDDQPA